MSAADANEDQRPVATRTSGVSPRTSLVWALTLGIAAAGVLIRPHLGESRLVPSPSVLALVLGLALGALPAVRARVAVGARAVSKQAIPFAIVLIGFGLDLGPLLASGTLGGSLAAVLVTMGVAFAAALIAGRLCGLDPRASLLLGAGTAVCGNSAIMAVAPTVQPDDEDLGLAIGVINLLGVAMLFALPPAAAAVGIGGPAGGALAGLTVHAVPQSIATGEAFGEGAVEWATLFKLIRVAMLVPLVVVLAFVLGRRRGERGEGAARGVGIPWFVVLFVVAAALRASGWFDGAVGAGDDAQPAWAWLRQAGSFLLAAALAAIGLTLQVRTLLRVGPKFLLAGGLTVVLMVIAAIPLVRWLFA